MSSSFSKLFNKGDDAVTKEQKEIEKKLKDINRLRYNNKKTLSAVEIENYTLKADVSFEVVW